NLSENLLQLIHARTFSTMPTLERLYCQSNELKELSFLRSLSGLKYLSLVDNEIITLNKEDFANLTQLEELFLDKNFIKAMTNDYFTNTRLQVLSLAKNDIHTITNAFHGLSSLKTL
ncbi:Leucine-rich repeat-containing G-protein coupled receptor 4, partial [Trichoplax sp. H2]